MNKIEDNKLTINQKGQDRNVEATPTVPEEAGTIRLPNKEEISYAKQISENIIKRQTEINEIINNLNEAEKEFVLGEMSKEYGVELAKLKREVKILSDNPSLPISNIFPNLGWLPISEMLQRVELDFQFGSMIPIKTVRNGLHRIFYRDFWKVDNMSAYSQKDYQFDPIHNPKGGIVTEEIWPVTTNIHIGFTMWSSMLNQNTRDIALFLAIFNEFEWNIVKPVSLEFYRVQLRMSAVGIDYNNYPLDKKDGSLNGVDWSKIEPDVEIKGYDDYDALEKLFSYMIGLDQPSRKNLPTRWNPKGMAQNLMTQFKMEDYVLLVPVAFEQYLRVQMKSGRFHDNYLNMLPEVKAIDYDKAFGEFNGDTGYGTTYKNCDLRLIPKATDSKGAWIISQYEGTRSQPNLNFTEVTHFWQLYGVAFHRETPILNIKFTVENATPTKPKLDTIITTSNLGEFQGVGDNPTSQELEAQVKAKNTKYNNGDATFNNITKTTALATANPNKYDGTVNLTYNYSKKQVTQSYQGINFRNRKQG